MSRGILVALVACLALFSLARAALVCVKSPVAIRSEPSENGEILFEAAVGDRFDTLDEMGMRSGLWYHVQSIATRKVGYAYIPAFGVCDLAATNTSQLGKYSPSGALSYASKWYSSANHKCSSAYDSCTPWAYFGEESCGYPSHGGDCADFVSQCLIAGGHPYLNTGFPCRGYPCGKEEVGAKNLGDCLHNVFHWNRTCGYKQAPPSYIHEGDVLVYHSGSCSGEDAHATIVTEGSGSDAKISCHSPDTHNAKWTIFQDVKPYLEWLHYVG